MTTLVLYKDCKINEERNAIIDNIETYLSSLVSKTISDFQYVKIHKTTSIKLTASDISQADIINFPYGYIKVIQDDNYSPVYFFITGTEWISERAVKLNIKLDSLNTFQDKFEFTDNTYIERQHAQRYRVKSRDTLGNIQLDFKIDRTSEGITPLKKRIDSPSKITENPIRAKADNLKFYLVYIFEESMTQPEIVLVTDQVCYIRGFDGNVLLYPEGHMLGGSPIPCSVKNIDKTVPSILKIIEIPYSVGNITFGADYNGHYTFLAGTHISELPAIQHIPNAETLGVQITDNDLITYLNIISFRDDLRISIPEAGFTSKTKDINLESKLKHSDFTSYKFYYDNFSLEWKLENDYESEVFYPKFVMNKDLSNAGLFDITGHKIEHNAGSAIYDSDYPNILAFDRNNEIALYSSDYLNYLRVGYNYDVKRRDFSVVTGLATGAMAVGRSTSASGNILSGIGGAFNIIATNVQNEWNIQEKLDQLAYQGNNVKGVDNVTILNYYNENKLWRTKYSVSDNIKNQLFHMFYLYGYAKNTYGIPDTNSRRFFNYVKGDVKFSNDEDGIFINFMDDIKELFKAGVTYYHRAKLSQDGAYIYDWNQEYENWEISLCDRDANILI